MYPGDLIHTRPLMKKRLYTRDLILYSVVQTAANVTYSFLQKEADVRYPTLYTEKFFFSQIEGIVVISQILDDIPRKMSLVH